MPTRPRTPHHRPWRPRRRGLGRGVGLAGDQTSPLGATPQITFGDSVPPATRQKLGIRVWIAPGADPAANPSAWSWVEITPWVLYENRIRIRRGQENEQTQTSPSQCTLRLKNFRVSNPTDPAFDVAAPFTPANPFGPWFGLLKINVPLKVELNPGTGWSRRFTGFIDDWPTKSDQSGQFRYVDIVASGVSRRYQQGNTPIHSFANLVVTANVDSGFGSIVGWWSLEDVGPASTIAPSGLPGGVAITITGTPGVETPPGGVASAPSVTGCSFQSSPLTTGVPGNGFDFAFMAKLNDGVSITDLVQFSTNGTVNYALDVSGTTLTLRTNAPGSLSTSVSCDLTDGEWHVYNINIAQSGANILASVYVDNLVFVAGPLVIPTQTAGLVEYFNFNPSLQDVAGLSTIVIGSNAAYIQLDETTMNGAIPTDTAGRQFGRVADRSLGTGMYQPGFFTSGYSEYVGGQQAVPLMDALREMVVADEGFLVERLNGLIGMDSHVDRENLPVGMVIDSALGQLQAFDPATDDQYRRNLWVISRTDGSNSGPISDSTGPLGTGSTGIGTYDDSATLNLGFDYQTIAHADYRVVHGTVPEARHPSIRIQLAKAQNVNLISQWLGLTTTAAYWADLAGSSQLDPLGCRVQILHPSSDLAPETIDQMILGYTEEFDQLMWDLDINGIPYSPYRIFETAPAADLDVNQQANDSPSGIITGARGGDFLGTLDVTTCTLAAGALASDLTISVTTDVLWSTDLIDYAPRGILIHVQGEQMLVTGAAGAANPQTLSVVRAVNGISRALTLGAALTIDYPGTLWLGGEL